MTASTSMPNDESETAPEWKSRDCCESALRRTAALALNSLGRAVFWTRCLRSPTCGRGVSVGIGTTFGAGEGSRKSHGWYPPSCGAGVTSGSARPPCKASKAGAAASMRGRVSRLGRSADPFIRRPQRMQRRSSSSFQAWQWTHCILDQFLTDFAARGCYNGLSQGAC